MMSYFQFTLGPVQSFVAQARRTRDFWVGSFLLSYLTAHSMMPIIKNDGEILFPKIKDNQETTDPLLKYIESCEDNKKIPCPTIGSIPNRFLAEVPDNFDGKQCIDAVNEAWAKIAGEIWKKYVISAADHGHNTERIWKRQVNNFWEMSWVIGDEPDLLDRRKNLRCHIPPMEFGDKCTLMGDWQELSGYLRIRNRSKQNRFWKELYYKTPGEDIREDERLCSIALIKRLFPYFLMKGGVSYPSTPYLAAVPWLSSIINDNSKHEIACQFTDRADKKMFGNENSAIFFSKEKLDGDLGGFIDLDGNCFFKITLENDNLWSSENDETACRRNMVKLLDGFKSEPTPFYAMLVMDGDRIGSLLAEKDNRIAVSRSLSNFSGKVEGIMSKYKGITVYAGGDDVLALLPMDSALHAARELRNCFTECFSKEDSSLKTTISAAIVYAHIHAPLQQIIAAAQQILDEEAKEKTGRDALAVAVWKTGGIVINWSAPWDIENDVGGVISKIDSLISSYANKQMSSSWLYGIRDLLGNIKGNEFKFNEDIELLTRLLAADLVKNRERDIKIAEAERVVEDLLTICLPQRAEKAESGAGRKGFSLDGGLLIKFLATKEVA